MLYELRSRTAVVAAALALAMSASVLLRGTPRRSYLQFAAFSGTLGVWYLTQSFYGFFEAEIWQRATAIAAIALPGLASGTFESMVPRSEDRPSLVRTARFALALPLFALQLTSIYQAAAVRLAVFVYAFVFITAGLYELGQHGARSQSRSTARRIRLLVVIGVLAGLATLFDFLWILGVRTPPVGAVLSILFVFALSQALSSERLLDSSELLGRLVVAAAVAFLIAFIFYVLLSVIGTFNTMYLNAVLAATVLLVVYEPLQSRVEQQIRRLFFRERFDLEGELATLRRKLVHTLEIGEMVALVMDALERSRRVTCAALYLRDQEGSGFDQVGFMGDVAPQRLEVATARALLERLEQGPVLLEDVAREVADSAVPAGNAIAVLAAAEVLGALKSGVLVAIRDEKREMVGLLALADRRVRDAVSADEVGLLEQLANQLGVVVQNSSSYQQMKERDRLALLGQMAAGLAHEIRNPLGAIKGAAQLLSEPGPNASLDASTAEFLGIILEEVDRLNRVVGSVLDLARPGEGTVAPVDINAVVRRTMQVLSADRREGDVEVLTSLANELPRVSIDPEQLRQVLMNLVQNAVQAVDDRGRVTVSTRIRLGRGTRSGRPDADTYVELTVADTGPGIPRSTLEKLFIPFFTTKETGTGLGLAISQRIVQSAGGRIEVRSLEGKGTTFTVVLPAALDARMPPSTDRASGEPSSRVAPTP